MKYKNNFESKQSHLKMYLNNPLKSIIQWNK